MAFDPKKLPPKVYEAYKMGAIAWPLVVQEALDAGITSRDKLTDIVFYLHNPERKGRALDASETELIKMWKAFRGLVASRHSARTGQTAENENKLWVATVMPGG